MSRLFLTLLTALSLAPIALADTGSYVGGGVITGFCTSGDTGFDTGIVCELACTTCEITVTDDLGAPVLFQVCDWDAAAGEDNNCSDLVTSGYVHASLTGVVDIFLTGGTTGTVTTTEV